MTPEVTDRFIAGYWMMNMAGLVVHHIWYYIQLRKVM